MRGGGAQSAAAACQTVADTLSDGVAALPDAEHSVGFRGKRGSAVQTPRAKGRARENQTMGTGAAKQAGIRMSKPGGGLCSRWF